MIPHLPELTSNQKQDRLEAFSRFIGLKFSKPPEQRGPLGQKISVVIEVNAVIAIKLAYDVYAAI